MLAVMIGLPAHATPVCPTEVHIHGHSLEPLLPDGAEVPLKATDCLESPAHGDFALFKSASSTLPLIKVIVAMPGDTLVLRRADENKSHLFVNGREAVNSVNTAYAFDDRRRRMLDLYVSLNNGVVPAATYLVLGDDPGGTQDSSRFGYVARADIVTFVARSAIAAAHLPEQGSQP
jgi:signal peptidase I